MRYRGFIRFTIWLVASCCATVSGTDSGISTPLRVFRDRRFPDDAVVNVTLPPYRAQPDDGEDDTGALQKAISENVGTGRVIYFPTGTYEVSDTLCGRTPNQVWRPHLTLQGQNRSSTILRLKDHSPGFDRPSSPKAIIVTGSFWEAGDATDGGGNKAFRNNVFDLTIDAGRGNPGAVGIEYAVSNQGCIGRVIVRSSDGEGQAGIGLMRRIPGPGLISEVAIFGFDVGIDYRDVQYGLTLENISLKDQNFAGIRVTDNLLHIRGLRSENRVPALIVSGRNGFVTLLDAVLTGRERIGPAIINEGNLFIRNLRTEGYSGIRMCGSDLSPPYPLEISAPGAMGEPVMFAPLPAEASPEYWNDDLKDWRAIGPRWKGETDDTAAIQRAIDSGKRTVYFPNGRTYFLSDTVVVRGSVRQVLGLGSEISLGAAEAPFGDEKNPRPLIRLDPTDFETLHIDGIFFNAQYPGEVLFENNTPSTLVISHCAGWVGARGHRRSYRNTPRATGKVFINDVFLPGWEFSDQHVWARQFNPENWDGDGSSPQVSNHAGRLWILGFKTEGPAPFLRTFDGGTTEVWGSYNYVSATKSDPLPCSVPYLCEDSQVSLTFATDNFRDSDYPAYIRDIRGGKVREWKHSDLPARNGTWGCKSLAVGCFRNRPLDPGTPAHRKRVLESSYPPVDPAHQGVTAADGRSDGLPDASMNQ